MDSSQCPLSKLVAPLFVGTNNQSIGNGGSKKEGRHPIAYQECSLERPLVKRQKGTQLTCNATQRDLGTMADPQQEVGEMMVEMSYV